MARGRGAVGGRAGQARLVEKAGEDDGAAADAALVKPAVLPFADEDPAEVQGALAGGAHGRGVVLAGGLLGARGELG